MGWLDRWFNRDNRSVPDYWSNYQKSFQHKPAGNTPIEELRFVVLDTETTGFDRDKAILSIGAVAITKGQIDLSDSFEAIVKQASNSKAEAISIHGIMPEMSLSGLPSAEVLACFIGYLSDAIIVAHNAQYDVNMINSMISSEFPGKLRNKVLDTADLAIRVERYGEDPNTIKRSEYTLDQLCERYNIDVEDRHTAAGDAFITARLLLLLLAKARKRGIRTFRDLKLN